jgi:TolB-like protein/class 3 adenylate cyclase/Tfp pilus assembly protein PilF
VKRDKRKLAAIMITDMVGYSALTRRDESLSLRLLQQHRKRLRSFFGEFGGQEIKSTGDGFLVQFDSALQGGRCAVAIQRGLSQDNRARPADQLVQVRIGLHVGEVVEHAGDVFGDAVNIASRLEPQAEPGGICLSQQAYDQVCDKLPARIVPAGKVELRKLGQMSIYRVDLSDTRVEPQPTSQIADSNHRSIAVLPLVNLSPNLRDEYLSDGLTEELISVLGRLESLRVVSSTSTFAYKGRPEDVRKIGQQLNVRAVLEGSLRRRGNEIRIAVRLVNVTDGFQIWAETYERRLRDVFAIQEEVARHVVDALHPNILAGSKPPALQAATQNPAAYQLYLKGRFYWNQRSSDGMVKALNCFRKAVRVDSRCALAFAGMADCYSLLTFYGGLAPRGAFARAKAAAQKAVYLDGALAETHTALAYALLHQDWDLAGSAREFETALKINPAHAPAHLWYGIYFSVRGLHDQAIAEVSKARELEPLSATVTAAAAMAHYFARRYGPAIRLFNEALDVEPDFVLAHEGLGQVYLQQRAWRSALAHLDAAMKKVKSGGSLQAAKAYAFSREGRSSRAKTILRKMSRQILKGDVSPVDVAIIHLGLSDLDSAFQWLQRAVRQHSGRLVYLKANPIFSGLHPDPRYASLLRKVGLR